MGSVFSGSGLACCSVCVMLCDCTSVLLFVYLGGDRVSPVVMFVTEVSVGCASWGGGIVMPLVMSAADITWGIMVLGFMPSSNISNMSCIWSACCSGLVVVLVCGVGVVCADGACAGGCCGVEGVSGGMLFVVWCRVCVLFVSGGCCVGEVGLCAVCVCVDARSGLACGSCVSGMLSILMLSVFLTVGGASVPDWCSVGVSDGVVLVVGGGVFLFVGVCLVWCLVWIAGSGAEKTVLASRIALLTSGEIGLTWIFLSSICLVVLCLVPQSLVRVILISWSRDRTGGSLGPVPVMAA